MPEAEKLDLVKTFVIPRAKWGGRKLRASTGCKLCSLGHWLAACEYPIPRIPLADLMEVDANWFKESPQFLADELWQERVTAAAVAKDEEQTKALFAEKGLIVTFAD